MDKVIKPKGINSVDIIGNIVNIENKMSQNIHKQYSIISITCDGMIYRVQLWKDVETKIKDFSIGDKVWANCYYHYYESSGLTKISLKANSIRKNFCSTEIRGKFIKFTNNGFIIEPISGSKNEGQFVKSCPIECFYQQNYYNDFLVAGCTLTVTGCLKFNNGWYIEVEDVWNITNSKNEIKEQQYAECSC